MTSPVLFSTGSAPSGQTTSRNLVEFKAGKMELRDKIVHPINKQGLVYLRQSQDDNLMHFCWKDRTTGVTEDDLILFPDDNEFKRVKECKTGRVYVLKMKSSGKKMFFWMQENKIDRDEEFCKKINDMLNNPPSSGSDLGNGTDRDLQSLLGNLTQEQMASLLSTNGISIASLLGSTGRSPSCNSGTSANSTAGSTNNSAPNSATSAANLTTGTREQLDSMLCGAISEADEDEENALMEATLASQAGSAEGSQPQQQQQTPLIDLSTAVNSESLAHLLNDEEFLKQIEPHLPPIMQQSSSASAATMTTDERKKQFGETVRSSQFRSSLSQFCVALQSGQLGPLMSQFGLSQACVDAASLGNLEAFVRALDAQMKDGASSTATSATTTTTSSSSSSSQPKDKN